MAASPRKPVLKTLKACKCLERVGPVLLETLAAAATPVELREDEVLFANGQVADAAYVVCSGWLTIETVDADGRAALLDLAAPGALLSFVEAIADQPHAATVRAATPVALVRLPAQNLRRAFRSDPLFRRAALHAANLQIVGAIEQVEWLKGRSCLERVARFLLDLSGRRAGAAFVELPIEKRLIARWAGMTEWTISRVLADLRPHGLEMTGRKVRIADVRAFRRSLGLSPPPRPRAKPDASPLDAASLRAV
jgi:CRP-like cAMP-binding protein